ncbi:MAG: 1-acyl-sn-glycerol-3-phosphate acyltransferase [Anaerolineales bacterium]|nr:1-acyl-sn-glycerol-3-phosphate acyltransferase [Chloroflexota bacterium]MBL6983692.1 1-acyl-sn-glycerol-3-phosphate acyltransferase [Anaerolineales bacterium]
MTEYYQTTKHRVVNVLVKWAMSLICRVNAEQLQKVPTRGPMIVITNHINFLDAPILYVHTQPRPMRGFAKIETWDSTFLGFLFSLWNSIPVRRGKADMKAVRQGVAALKEGHFLCIAPEGTRSGHGRLSKGHAGMVTFALLSGAPFIVIAHYGAEKYRENLRKLKRTDFNIAVGEPFRLNTDKKKATHAEREQMTDEIMYQLAKLLPPEYRGEYADLNKATQMYIEPIPLNQKENPYGPDLKPHGSQRLAEEI